MIHFKIKASIGVNYFREGKYENNYEEIWISKDKIDLLQHEYDCGTNTYHVNEFEVSFEEFKKVLEQLGEKYGK